MDVPLIVLVAESLPTQADLMYPPGAKITRQLPQFEKLARPSVDIVAPTLRTAGSDAGE